MTRTPPPPALDHPPCSAGTPVPGVADSPLPATDHDWSAQARLYSYAQAANPVRAGLTEPIPLQAWPASLHAPGPTAVLPLDLSQRLGCPGPATSPALAAHFLRLQAGDGLKAEAVATSSLFYVLQGCGQLRRPAAAGAPELSLDWGRGDLFVLPCGAAPLLQAEQDAVLYWVHDGPLLHYLGVAPLAPRFAPTAYPAHLLEQALQELLADAAALRSNRLSLLLGQAAFPATRTVTHTLWAMLGIVPAGVVQPPHRHQSVALDLIIDCDPGCHTLVGSELGDDGTILRPQRIDWEPGGAFITPPGLWHAHVNPGARAARLLPIQDAGLHTHLRSLDIRFAGGLQTGS